MTPDVPDRAALAQLAPRLARLAEETLFGDIWQRPTLSARERSLITLAILASLGRVQQLPWHWAGCNNCPGILHSPGKTACPGMSWKSCSPILPSTPVCPPQ